MGKLLNFLYLHYFKYKMSLKGCRFAPNCKISSDDIFEGNNYIAGWVKNCHVGRGTYIMDGGWFQNCSIGRYCSIAAEVKMVARRGHPTRNFVATSPVFHLKRALVDTYVSEDKYDPYERGDRTERQWDAVIGNDVWIGTRTMLIGCVHIGDGAIVGAGSVVTKDVPPYAVVAGNPAKILRYRFSEEQIKKLQDIAWWNQGEEWIKEHAEMFSAVDEFIQCNDDSMS